MREIISIGKMDFVLESRQKLLDFCFEFLDLVHFDSKIETANDPFFTNDAILKNIYQSSVNSKYEILAKLNYSGDNLAIGSINWHGDFFGKAFNAKDKDDRHIYSCCLGFGLERIVYAFLAQYGCDTLKWPLGFLHKYRSFIEKEEELRDTLLEKHDKSLEKKPDPIRSAPTQNPIDRHEKKPFIPNREELLKIFHDILEIQAPPPEITRDKIETWDSLNHVQLIAAIEEKFSIKIQTDNIGELHADFATIYKYLEGI